MCYDCKKKHGVEYNHAVYFSGSNDGFYCKPCDATLACNRTDKRHNAYEAIVLLKEELHTWNKQFKKRQEKAEELVRSFAK